MDYFSGCISVWSVIWGQWLSFDLTDDLERLVTNSQYRHSWFDHLPVRWQSWFDQQIVTESVVIELIRSTDRDGIRGDRVGSINRSWRDPWWQSWFDQQIVTGSMVTELIDQQIIEKKQHGEKRRRKRTQRRLGEEKGNWKIGKKRGEKGNIRIEGEGHEIKWGKVGVYSAVWFQERIGLHRPIDKAW